MELEGKIWKSGKFWLVEVPSLDAMTQGKSRAEALFMIEDLVYEMVVSYFKDEMSKDFKVTVSDQGKKIVGITANDAKLLQALSPRRQMAPPSF
jgi:predicted RNase H-like HicB family nuclease